MCEKRCKSVGQTVKTRVAKSVKRKVSRRNETDGSSSADGMHLEMMLTRRLSGGDLHVWVAATGNELSSNDVCVWGTSDATGQVVPFDGSVMYRYRRELE